jgi:heme-degrading monooxygenase HmoA
VSATCASSSSSTSRARGRPGFISVNLLTSNDGTRVVNYAQWRTLEDIKAAQGDPDVQEFVRRAAGYQSCLLSQST